MNREQAERILDAYVHMMMRDSDKDASDALREVILDVMSEYRSNPTTIYPGITLGKPLVTYTGTGDVPTNWDGTPKVTCTGIDPVFGVNTAAVEERAEG